MVWEGMPRLSPWQRGLLARLAAEEGFRHYLPQPLCYADIVAKARPDKPVQGVAVNWIMHGCVTMMGVGTSFNKHGRFDIS